MATQTQDTTKNGQGSHELAKVNPNAPAGDLRSFSTFLSQREKAIGQVCASHMNPKRITKILLAAVMRTPALKECTIASIVDAGMKAAELGLEPGSATGEAYLVPYGKTCTLIPGYRGLIALAFRSGYVVSVKAGVVYQGDTFEYEEGLTPKLRHVPAFDQERDAKAITFAYCVVHLKDGGVCHDVMTRGEIDQIRKRSKAGGNGPWVTDYAEMAKKTVARRCLKYAPMSVEMGKALALEAVEHGEFSPEQGDAAFDYIDVDPETGEVVSTKTDKLKDRLGVDGAADGDDQPEALI